MKNKKQLFSLLLLVSCSLAQQTVFAAAASANPPGGPAIDASTAQKKFDKNLKSLSFAATQAAFNFEPEDERLTPTERAVKNHPNLLENMKEALAAGATISKAQEQVLSMLLPNGLEILGISAKSNP
jgi:hypothetical protein